MTVMKYDLDALVRPDQELRKVSKTVDFTKTARKYIELKTTAGRKGCGLDTGIKCLFLQFYCDLPDRESENRLRYDIAFRRFCGISLDGETPGHTFFCRIRNIFEGRKACKVPRINESTVTGIYGSDCV